MMYGNESSMDYSVLKQYYSANTFLNFSIKYVIEGVEHYQVNGNEIQVECGQYLLAGPHSKGHVLVDSKEFVKGTCIALSEELISEVVAMHLEPGAAIADLSLEKFFTSPDFPENKYGAKSTQLGRFLSLFSAQLKYLKPGLLDWNKEFYYSIAECLVADQVPLYKPFQRLKVIRSGTKKDLFRRLLLAKDHIDSAFMLQIGIKDIARSGGLSEYHFLRLFKTVFGISPYQYLLRKRLQYAFRLLKTGHYTVSDAAIASGFSDIYTFSRAFKRTFGYAPSSLIS